MLCEKNGKRDSDTERRVYDSDDILLAFLTTVTDPSHSFRMTPYQFPHHRYRSLAFALDDAFRSPSS